MAYGWFRFYWDVEFERNKWDGLPECNEIRSCVCKCYLMTSTMGYRRRVPRSLDEVENENQDGLVLLSIFRSCFLQSVFTGCSGYCMTFLCFKRTKT